MIKKYIYVINKINNSSKTIILIVLLISSLFLLSSFLYDKSNEDSYVSEPKMNFEEFLANDLTDTQDFELKSIYTKSLYENAFNNNFVLGGIILHTGCDNNKDDTRYVLNYYIKNNVFFIINPQTDKIYTLSEFSTSSDFPETYRYLTIFPDVLRIPSYKLTKQTREFDRENPINNSEMIRKVNSIYIYEPLKEVQPNEIQPEETTFEYPTYYLGLIQHKILYFIASSEHKIDGFEQKSDEYKQSYKLKQQCKDKRVHDSYSGGYIVGAKGDSKYLDNNCNAKDISYSELISFILKDDTDKMHFNYSSFVCADYAEMLHNNAEDAGIKCAYVSIAAPGVTQDGTVFSGHALNAFNTTDKGLIYIDCTGSLDGSSMDNVAIIKSNAIYYTPLYDSDYYVILSYMNVENIELVW